MCTYTKYILKVLGVQKNLQAHIQNKPSIHATLKSSISRNCRKKLLEMYFIFIDHANFITLVLIPKTLQYNHYLHNSSSAVTIINISEFFQFIFYSFYIFSTVLPPSASPPPLLHPHSLLRKDKTSHEENKAWHTKLKKDQLSEKICMVSVGIGYQGRGGGFWYPHFVNEFSSEIKG